MKKEKLCEVVVAFSIALESNSLSGKEFHTLKYLDQVFPLMSPFLGGYRI